MRSSLNYDRSDEAKKFRLSGRWEILLVSPLFVPGDHMLHNAKSPKICEINGIFLPSIKEHYFSLSCMKGNWFGITGIMNGQPFSTMG